MSNPKTINGILNAYLYGRMTKSESIEAINRLINSQVLQAIEKIKSNRVTLTEEDPITEVLSDSDYVSLSVIEAIEAKYKERHDV